MFNPRLTPAKSSGKFWCSRSNEIAIKALSALRRNDVIQRFRPVAPPLARWNAFSWPSPFLRRQSRVVDGMINMVLQCFKDIWCFKTLYIIISIYSILRFNISVTLLHVFHWCTSFISREKCRANPRQVIIFWCICRVPPSCVLVLRQHREVPPRDPQRCGPHSVRSIHLRCLMEIGKNLDVLKRSDWSGFVSPQ